MDDSDPGEAFRRGYALYRRGGHVAEAEAAYREAIARGSTEAWLYLGILLATRRGRRLDEKAAFRAAMASENRETAASAALRLGDVLDYMDDDRPAARACYEFAETHGTPRVVFTANERLSVLLARDGETQAARERHRAVAIQHSEQHDIEWGKKHAGLIAWMRTKVSGGPYTREVVRFQRRALFHARRARATLAARSEHLTASFNRIGRAAARLNARIEDD